MIRYEYLSDLSNNSNPKLSFFLVAHCVICRPIDFTSMTFKITMKISLYPQCPSVSGLYFNIGRWSASLSLMYWFMGVHAVQVNWYRQGRILSLQVIYSNEILFEMYILYIFFTLLWKSIVTAIHFLPNSYTNIFQLRQPDWAAWCKHITMLLNITY